jgi:hypothetical protein
MKKIERRKPVLDKKKRAGAILIVFGMFLGLIAYDLCSQEK